MNFLKKLLPFGSAAEKPLHAGEIYHLWEGLTSGHKLVGVAETYIMNTEDTEVHALLKGIIQGAYLTRTDRLEKILKQSGFTVPPRPSTKLHQGKPGTGQEVKLTDDEVLNNLISWGQVILLQDARAVGSCTRESVRKVFTDLLFNDITGYNVLLGFGLKRKVLSPPPPATAGDNPLNVSELSHLWDELNARRVSVINLETYLSNTNDPELIKLLKRGLFDITMPQMEKMEKILKKEGFTVPPRPPGRLAQGPPGQTGKVKLNEDEITGVLTVAFQAAIIAHARGFIASIRKDIRDLFEEFLSTEIEEYQKVMDLATARHTLDNPPAVTSKTG